MTSRRDDRVRAVRLLLIGVVVFAVSTALAGDAPAAWEPPVGRWTFDLPSWLTPMFEVVMEAGTREAVIAAAIIATACTRYRVAAAVLIGGLTARLSSNVAKDAIDRGRPTAEALGRPLRHIVGNEGFPSSHAAIATGLATAFLLTTRVPPAVRVAVVAAAVLTGVARMHLAVHWPLDVVGGAGLGLATGAAAALLTTIRRPASPPSTGRGPWSSPGADGADR